MSLPYRMILRRAGRSDRVDRGGASVIIQKSIQISTAGHRDMHDLTLHVKEIVRDSGARKGLVHIFNVGSTGIIGTIEFEPGLQDDLPEWLDKAMAPGKDYGHEKTWRDGNAHSHLQATLMGPDLTVPIADGALVLGTWQQIFHLECDIKPRQRTIVVTIMGE